MGVLMLKFFRWTSNLYPEKETVIDGQRLPTFPHEKVGPANDCLAHTRGSCFLTDCETLCPSVIASRNISLPHYLSLYLTAGPFHFFTVIKNSLKSTARAQTCTPAHTKTHSLLTANDCGLVFFSCVFFWVCKRWSAFEHNYRNISLWNFCHNQSGRTQSEKRLKPRPETFI